MKPRILLSQSIVTITTSAMCHVTWTGRPIRSPTKPLMIDLRTFDTEFWIELLLEMVIFFCFKQSMREGGMNVHTERLKL